MLQLLERKPGDRLFSDAQLLAARRTVLSFEILLNVGISTFVLIPRICPSFVFTSAVLR